MGPIAYDTLLAEAHPGRAVGAMLVPVLLLVGVVLLIVKLSRRSGQRRQPPYPQPGQWPQPPYQQPGQWPQPPYQQPGPQGYHQQPGHQQPYPPYGSPGGYGPPPAVAGPPGFAPPPAQPGPPMPPAPPPYAPERPTAPPVVDHDGPTQMYANEDETHVVPTTRKPEPGQQPGP